MSTKALKAIATDQAPHRRSILEYLSDKRVAEGIAAVAGKYLSADRMLRLSVNAIKRTPKLLDCDPMTVLGAIMTSAALGLEPNTPQQQAFLIPYKRRALVDGRWQDVYECQFQVGARGFITLAYRSPYIDRLFASAIHDGDVFEHMLGSQTFLRFSTSLRERGTLIGAFSHVKFTNGGESACVLPLDELLKIRERSETYRSLRRAVEEAEGEKDRAKAQAKLAETPWVMWEDDMAAKSAIKKHAKQLPIAGGDPLMVASSVDSAGEAAQLDLRTMADPDAVRTVISDGLEPPQIEEQAPAADHPEDEKTAKADGSEI